MRLGDVTDELTRKFMADCAWDTIGRHLDPNQPRRLVAGRVMTRHRENNFRNPQELSIELPLPLLYAHEWTRPIGKVFAIESLTDAVTFRAELLNSDRLPWARDCWHLITTTELLGISAGMRSRGNVLFGRAFTDEVLAEISLCEQGVDRGARIVRCWTRRATVSITEPLEKILWDEAEKGPTLPKIIQR